MKHFLLQMVFLLCVARVFAQQLPQTSAYSWNPFQWNVAAAGSEQSAVITAGYRKQWSQFNGAPVTQLLNAHLPLDVARSGVGLRIQNDEIGAHRVTSASLGWSYHLVQKRGLRVSAGLGAGLEQYRIDGSLLRAPDGSYNEQTGLFTHNDDFLNESFSRAAGFNVEAGIWVEAQNLQIGLAMQPVFAPDFQYSASQNVKVQRPAHYNLYLGYTQDLGTNLTLKPSIWVQNDGIKTQTNTQLQIGYKQNLYLGLGTRGVGTGLVESVTYFVGGRINQEMMLGYCFDSVISPLKTITSGSHELVVRYTFSKPFGTGKLPPIIYNPRYL
jgi:type IX secretion system PorP/SprF family membrane protein